jgi:murein DD-endopeptidase MepM/ murein hydrolase activator NlpD
MAEKILLNKQNLQDIYAAFEVYFPDNVIFSADRPVSGRILGWKSRKDFIEDINKTLETEGIKINENSRGKVIKDAQSKLEELAYKAPEEEKVEATTPDKERRAQQEVERQKRETSAKESAANAKKAVETAIQKQQELQVKLKERQIYRKVSMPTMKPLNPATYGVMSEQAQANPEQFTNALAEEIKNRLTQTTPEGNEEEIALLSKRAATSVTRNLRGDSPAVEAATLYAISTNRDALNAIDPSLSGDVVGAANETAGIRIVSYYEDWRVISSAFGGEEFADNFLGPRDLRTIEVELSPSKQLGFEGFDLSQVPAKHLEFLTRQNEIFGHIQNYGSADIKSYMLRQVGTWVEAQVPRSAMLSKAFELPAIRAAMNIYVMGEPLVPTSLFGRIAIESGHGPILGWLGESTGVDLGVATASSVTGGYIAPAVAAAYYTTAAESIALTGGVMASEAFMGGAGAAMAAGGGAAAGAGAGIMIGQVAIPIPVVGAAIGAVVGAVLPKIIGKAKDVFRKGKDFFMTGIGAGFGLGLGVATTIPAIPLAILGGAGGFIFSKFSSGGLSGVSSGISSVLGGAVTGARVASQLAFQGMAGPLVGTLLAFPIIVTLILVIINSGAYIVPTSPLEAGAGQTIISPYISITKVANPPGPFENSDLPLTVEYTVTIGAKKSALTNVSIEYECSVIKEGSSPTCPSPDPAIPTSAATIDPSSPLTFTYSHTYDSKFSDSFVTDTISVTADAIEQSNAQAAGSATIKIGKPPEDCPAPWPVDHGYVSQGAKTSSSHSTLEALDIGVAYVPVKATHTGVVVAASSVSCYGNMISVKSTCQGKEFISRYAHLSAIGVQPGKTVTLGQTIGISGNSVGGDASCTTGAHLHYDFKYTSGASPSWPSSPPYMNPPFIPTQVPRGCVDNCGVNW